ncbi:MAG: hypothetical protein VX944_02150 [Myxococcota bacterium]|nr:hypothetical protein [Myxococcota bacterium]MEC9388853.1 hypothetical protein [Myxococcota bacterium]
MRDHLHLLLLVGLFMLFVDKPPNVDDANFIALARSAAANPWSPHDALINWGGTTERAFDVLSNPPGIAWWLAPVVEHGVFWMHLWMVPWLIMAAIGCRRLGHRIAGQGQLASLLICGAPIGMLASHSLTPDLPLLACTVWGMDAVMDDKRRHRGALIVGLGACFRYSALALIPLVVAWVWMTNGRRRASIVGAVAAVPFALLAVHDALAYGAVHAVAMTGFQSVSNGPEALFHKAAASLAAFGGAAVLPFLGWSAPRRTVTGSVVGAAIGWVGAEWAGHSGTAWFATVLSCAAGGASYAGATLVRDRTDRWLLAWMATGAVFLLGLRFAAARYWIPFFAPAVLIGLRRCPPVVARAAAVTTVGLSLLLASDDLDLALTQADAADVAATVGTGHIAGHWGFQHHLTERGWVSVEDDRPLPPGAWLAESRIAWPQEPSNDCFDVSHIVPMMDPNPGLRVHSAEGGANIHGHSIAGQPPLAVFAPWSVGTDPMDMLTLRRTCPAPTAE